MSSINMIISELAQSVQQADSVPVRRSLKLSIIHAYSEIRRKSYDNSKVTDKFLQQRFKLSLTDVPDGDLVITNDIPVTKIKRTTLKVPRPVRLSNGLPFHSIRTIGLLYNTEIAFIKEPSTQFYSHLPGMTNIASYDYINEYIYINPKNNNNISQIKYIIVESMFEQPQLIQTETAGGGVLNIDNISDDDEFLIPEDMINPIKKMVLEVFNPQVVRQTNEIPTPNLVK